MKIKITALLLALMLLFVSGCSGEKAEVSKKAAAQYVLALNPSVILPDGSVETVRNSVAKSISADVSKGGEPSLYENSAWRWLYSDGKEWNQRLIRSAALWHDANGNTKNGAPYSYTVTDDGASSLAVYDSSKMKLSGLSGAEIPKSGVLMSFTGDKEEALIYTADSDVTVTFSDFSGGNIAAVGSVAGVSTKFAKDQPKRNILLKIYKNYRIYWQNVINTSNPSVEFPEFSDIELKEGDSLIISAQAVTTEELKDLKTGNCDIPAYEKTTIKQVGTTEKVLVGYQDPYVDTSNIYFVNDEGESTFKIIRSSSLPNAVSKKLAVFRAEMSANLGVTVDMGNESSIATESDYELYIYDGIPNADSKAAMNEVRSGRAKNAGDFIIRVRGNKLIIAAATETALEFAFDFFLDNYCKDKDSKIPKNLDYVSKSFNPVGDLTVGGVPIENYRVVVSQYASMIETSAADYVVKEIARVGGVNVSKVTDYQAPAANEILIGDTNRVNYRGVANYATTANNSVDSKYKIKVSQGRVSVLGGQIYGVNAGAIKLTELLKGGSLATGFEYEGEYDGNYTLTNGYKLAYSDEFNGTKLSKTWTTEAQTESAENHYGGITTIEKANSYVKDGALIQEVKKNGNDVSFGSLYSNGSEQLRFMWGYVELRVKFSTTQGVCATFWTQADVTGGFLESDIYENFGDPFSLKHNLHTWEQSGHKNLMGGTDDVLNLNPGVDTPVEYGYAYHTVGWEWTADICNFYVDGNLTETFDCSADAWDIFDKPAWIIIAAEGPSATYGLPLPEDFTYGAVSYDWLHIYQQDVPGTVLYEKNKK